ncbi:H-NS family nucleoid-associated regulatory protein [Ralstonia pseudosolanacearum]|uniref:H-NS histone family protein n=1 Tax=Ralstonia pseudosolanacearum TaxID=1310165 RepID=UPI001FFA1EA0|nr:H-NS family nucleoid-associated regulatory protein [Ralstonia pseudosolanacearum]
MLMFCLRSGTTLRWANKLMAQIGSCSHQMGGVSSGIPPWSADDLGFGAKGGPASKKAGRKVPVRYRDSQGNTWTGRGKRPGWLVKELSAGKKVEDFLVA